METLDLGGLKSNWRAFKELVESKPKEYLSTKYYFVFREDDCGDEAYVFTSHSDLDEWLSKKFWEWELYDTHPLQDSMDDIKVWQLVSENEFKRWETLHEGSRKTKIVINGERYYRKLIPISVEPTVIVSTNSY